MIQPKLTLVGAGPGDPELITLKAVNALKVADVILYDALVNDVLLEYANPNAELIFVGKRVGCYRYQQDQINDIIVERALSKGHVVRLKGGDPFVFGRGAEEIEHAQQFNIPCVVVPGISSSVSVPAYNGISITKRGASESFWVITGTTKNHTLSTDVELASKSTATVVILMGMGNLSQIVDLFKAEGKSETAIAIIQNGTRADEKVGIGTIATIEAIVAKKELKAPSIIVIGEVVKQRVQLDQIAQKAQSELVLN